ncbi:MAG TPA: GNAT family N-acetyltransferase [Terriglobales bacterium]|jgi:GNAT superfamily N-acetyltransferase|nr:GNAT family N-acetyltransferase [Terriglobales bacterium]
MSTCTTVPTRLAGSDDLEQIGRLLPLVAGPQFPERYPGRTVTEFCHWKYFTNPAGEAAVGVAVDGAKIVSLAAGVPKRVKLGDDTVIAYELGDFITDPAYRKRGLFSAVINLVCEEAARRGAAFAYVRPNESSFRILTPGLNFIEARKIDERRYFVPSSLVHRKTGWPASLPRALGLDWLARESLLPSRPASVKVERATRFGAENDILWQSAREQYAFTLSRDTSYMNWRYVDGPTPYQIWVARRDAHPVGYVVTFASPSEPIAYVIDLFTLPQDSDAASALLRTAVDSLLADDVQVVYTWTVQSSASSAGHRLLKRACAAPVRPHLHLAIRFLSDRLDASRLPADGWQLTAGDFDGI